MRSRVAVTFIAVAALVAACGGDDSATEVIDSDDLAEWAATTTTTTPSDTSTPTTSPAASPPATVAAPPLTEREPGCLDTVAKLPKPAPISPTISPLKAALAGEIAPLPVPGHEDAVITSRVVTETVEEFFDTYTNIIAADERRAVMERVGFVMSVGLELAHDDDRYDVTVMQFETAEGAREYYDVHLRRICRDAVNLRALPEPAGGVIYTRVHDDYASPRAVALVGSVEISTTICQCVGVDDLEALAGDWVTAIARQVTSDGQLT